MLRNVLLLPPSTITDLVMAIITLHNFLRKGPSRNIYCPSDLIDSEDPRSHTVNTGNWHGDIAHNSMHALQTSRSGHNASTEAKDIRDTFKEYFFNEGAVSWQWNICM